MEASSWKAEHVSMMSSGEVKLTVGAGNGWVFLHSHISPTDSLPLRSVMGLRCLFFFFCYNF